MVGVYSGVGAGGCGWDADVMIGHNRNPLSPANEGYSFAGQLSQSPIMRDAIYRSPAAPACIYIPGAEGTMELPFVLPRFSVGRVGGSHEGWVIPEDISGFADPVTMSGTSTWGGCTMSRNGVVYFAPQGNRTATTDGFDAVGIASPHRVTLQIY